MKTREYKTYATPGSKEAHRRSALYRKESVMDYCSRHGLTQPTTSEDVRRIDMLVFTEAMERIHKKCAEVRDANLAK